MSELEAENSRLRRELADAKLDVKTFHARSNLCACRLAPDPFEQPYLALHSIRLLAYDAMADACLGSLPERLCSEER